jgi:hypothetical protein
VWQAIRGCERVETGWPIIGVQSPDPSVISRSTRRTPAPGARMHIDATRRPTLPAFLSELERC